MAKDTKEKAKKAVKETASFASDNWKEILIVGALGLGMYLAYRSFKGIGSTINDIGDNANPGDTQNSNTGNNVPYGATISQNQALNIASGLLQAMDGAGTDKAKIFSLLSNKTNKDLSMIVNAFGTPRYFGTGLSVWPAAKRNLPYWLNAELSTSELNELKQIAPGLL